MKLQSRTNSATAADAMLAGEARPHCQSRVPRRSRNSQRVPVELDFSWFRANGMCSAAAEARFLRLVRYSVTSESESEFAESSYEKPPLHPPPHMALELVCQEVHEAW